MLLKVINREWEREGRMGKRETETEIERQWMLMPANPRTQTTNSTKARACLALLPCFPLMPSFKMDMALTLVLVGETGLKGVWGRGKRLTRKSDRSFCFILFKNYYIIYLSCTCKNFFKVFISGYKSCCYIYTLANSNTFKRPLIKFAPI